MVAAIWEFIVTLFIHRKVIRGLNDEVAALQGQLSQLRLQAVPADPDFDAEWAKLPETDKPVRLIRKTYLAEKHRYEYDHNRRLKEAVEKARLGMM